MQQCVLFDFDGVIVDSEPFSFAQMCRMLQQEYNAVLPPQACAEYAGHSGEEMVASIIHRLSLPITPAEFDQAMQRTECYYASDQLAPMEGARACIQYLRRMGMRTALVSSTQKQWIQLALRRLEMEALFDVIVCGDMVRRTKPDPECYLLALQRLGAPPHLCTAVEDSPVGICAAKAAGLRVIALCQSAVRQDVRAADARADNFAQLAGLITCGADGH